jgi:hypothetical protein
MHAPSSVYTTSDSRPARRAVIEEAKRKVPCIDLADRLVADNGGRWRKVGDRWTTRFVLPGHEETSASFVVYPGDRGWWCFGCQRGGSVVDLAMHAWDIDRADVAAAETLLIFGHEIPPRPASWFAKQRRQQPARDALEEAKIAHVQRRVFRIFACVLADISDEVERREEAAHLWDASREIAVLMLAGRRAA